MELGENSGEKCRHIESFNFTSKVVIQFKTLSLVVYV